MMEGELANMPPEFRGKTQKILCCDCNCYSEVPFHFQFHRCANTFGTNSSDSELASDTTEIVSSSRRHKTARICGSYNTRLV
jgi:Zinc-ribbon